MRVRGELGLPELLEPRAAQLENGDDVTFACDIEAATGGIDVLIIEPRRRTGEADIGDPAQRKLVRRRSASIGVDASASTANATANGTETTEARSYGVIE
jgi:hypothetical protein